MKIIILTLVCIVAGNMAARVRRSDEDVEAVVAAANHRLTARMFAEVVKQQPRKSVVMSAYSLLSPLGQLELAADGETRAELDSVIGIPSSSFNEAFKWMNKNVRNVQGIELKEASKIYIPKGAELNDSYASVAREVFESVAENVDFSDKDAAVAKINSWVEEQTNNKIKDLVDPNSVSSNTVAVLVNALYFKGKWAKPFESEATGDRDFHVNIDKIIQLPTMYRTDHFRYAEIDSLDAKIIELPYHGNDASMFIILPHKIDGIEELERKLTDTSLQSAIESMKSTKVNVFIPKFKIETTTDLKKVLRDMDVNKIFNIGEANLKNLLKDGSDFFIDQATQKAFIEVNEEGTEAAAANAFSGFALAMYEEEKDFDADRPFAFLIAKGKLTLFSGVFQPE